MMLDILQQLQVRMTLALVPAHVGKVYLGISGLEREALISDYDLLIFDDGGEDPIQESTSSTECIMYHIKTELLVRATDVPDSLSHMLTRWRALETELFREANKKMIVAGTIYTESIGGFLSVSTDFVGEPGSPLWRRRSAVVDYREALYRGGRHPF